MIVVALAIEFFVTPIQVTGWVIIGILALAIVANVLYVAAKYVYAKMTSVFDD